MRKFWIALFLITYASFLLSQDKMSRLDQKELTLRIGVTKNTVRDARIGVLPFSSWSPKYDISYTKINDKRISEIRFQFAYMKSGGNGFLGLTSIRPNVNYSYQRKISTGVWIGGFLESNTLLNFPNTKSGLFNNNPINYTISESIGPRITHIKDWKMEDSRKFQIRTSAQTSMLSYLIQPAWGHPYPSQFLKQGTFNPERNGMAWPIAKSGKVTSINKHRTLRVELGFYLFLSDKFKVGIDLQAEVHYANTIGKAVHLSGQDFFLGASYIH